MCLYRLTHEQETPTEGYKILLETDNGLTSPLLESSFTLLVNHTWIQMISLLSVELASKTTRLVSISSKHLRQLNID